MEMAEKSSTMEIVHNFIKANYYLSDKYQKIDPNISLMESGIIDSTGILQLIDFLEERFGITIENEDISLKNFETLLKISIFVDGKKH
jgi:acyl carrier protein